ncbi:MAG: hypothetical protein RLZZ587_140 [Actinomycetota bacterium]|jgi:putative ABC transport system permease protein
MARNFLRTVSVSSWLDLRANPLSGFLTGISLVVGALSVIGIASATTIVNDSLIAQAEVLSGRATTIGATANSRTVSKENVDQLNLLNAKFSAIGFHSIVSMAPSTQSFALTNANVRGREKPQQVFVQFTIGDRGLVFREPVIEVIDQRQTLAPNVAVNEAARDAIGKAGTCPSITISSISQPVTVCVRSVIVDGHNSPAIYIPLREWFAIKPEPLTGVDVGFAVHADADEGSMASLVRELSEPIGAVETVSIQRIDTVSSLESMRATVSNSLAAIGLVAAILSALGIINIGLAQTRERAREIAIRRAYGATRNHVFGEVVGSMAIIGSLAALVAGMIGYCAFQVLVPHFVSASTGIEIPAFPWASLAAAFALNLATVLVGSFYPAIKAGRSGLLSLIR